jgi:hypothetical protein
MVGRIPGMSGPLVLAGRTLETPGLDNRLIDCDKVVSPTHRPHFTPQKHYVSFNVSCTHFC